MSRDDLQHRVLVELRACQTALAGLGHRFATVAAVHPTDLQALDLLSRCGEQPPTAGELGARLELSSGAVTGLVDRLERAGHVERTHDPGDRRRIRVRMTAQAQGLAHAHFGAYVERLRAVMADVPDTDLERIADFLAAARDAADDVSPP